MGLKTGLGIGAAALLALGLGGAIELNATRTLAKDAALAAAESRAHSQDQLRALETKLEGSRNEIDALRRLVESRNVELTSLRDKLAEMDKAKAASPFSNRIVTRRLNNGGQTVTMTGGNGEKPEAPIVTFFADAATVDANGNKQQVQFPGGNVVIQGDAIELEAFDFQVAPGANADEMKKNAAELQARVQDVLKKKLQNVDPNNPNMPKAGVRVQLAPAVVPPKPPEQLPAEKADGNF